jgi:hypothetical protein
MISIRFFADLRRSDLRIATICPAAYATATARNRPVGPRFKSSPGLAEEKIRMANKKVKGTCENCSLGGVLEIVEVTKLGATEQPITLRLCKRCATVPSAIWRRRYRPVGQGLPASR